jgi:tRNA/rRNA methyltransferase
VERLTVLLTEMMEETGYTKRHPANCDEAQIRRLVLRMGVSERDVPVWMGIVRQVLWRVRGSHEKTFQIE